MVPVITVALTFTLELHPYLLYGLHVTDHGWVHVLEATPGPWMYFYPFHAYAVMVAGVALLISSAGGANPLYRRQAAVLVTAIVIPLVLDAVSSLDPAFNVGDVLNPVSFSVSGAVITWGLYRYVSSTSGPSPVGRSSTT